MFSAYIKYCCAKIRIGYTMYLSKKLANYCANLRLVEGLTVKSTRHYYSSNILLV